MNDKYNDTTNRKHLTSVTLVSNNKTNETIHAICHKILRLLTRSLVDNTFRNLDNDNTIFKNISYKIYLMMFFCLTVGVLPFYISVSLILVHVVAIYRLSVLQYSK